jgi:hypothetical protein
MAAVVGRSTRSLAIVGIALDRTSAVKNAIRSAFSKVEYPGDWCLRGSNEGDEPYLLEAEFKGKTDWSALDPGFLDQAPDGLGTALSFFSDEAFHFYLPAYLVADIDGLLKQHDPSFQLTHGLDDASRNKKINPRRYGERTWFEAKRYMFSMFSRAEAVAIVEYLKLRRDRDEIASPNIDEALRNYWNERAGNNDG